MPCFIIKMSVELTEEQKKKILKDITNVISIEIGKPKQYIMGTVAKTEMIMSDDFQPAVFVEVRSIGGLNPGNNKKLSFGICSIIKEITQISGDRIFINFIDIERTNWGWKGSTL